MIPRVTYGLSTYPKLGLSRAELKKMDSLIVGWTFSKRKGVETG